MPHLDINVADIRPTKRQIQEWARASKGQPNPSTYIRERYLIHGAQEGACLAAESHKRSFRNLNFRRLLGI